MSPCLESLVLGAGEEEEEEVLIATSPLLPRLLPLPALGCLREGRENWRMSMRSRVGIHLPPKAVLVSPSLSTAREIDVGIRKRKRGGAAGNRRKEEIAPFSNQMHPPLPSPLLEGARISPRFPVGGRAGGGGGREVTIVYSIMLLRVVPR